MLEFFEGYFQFLTKLEDNYFKVINKKKEAFNFKNKLTSYKFKIIKY